MIGIHHERLDTGSLQILARQTTHRRARGVRHKKGRRETPFSGLYMTDATPIVLGAISPMAHAKKTKGWLGRGTRCQGPRHPQEYYSFSQLFQVGGPVQ